IYSVSEKGYASGYSTSMVAYLISPQSAKFLIDFSEQITEKYGSINYSSWDSEIDGFLRSHHFKNYIPFRNYGEHGGIPNPEHGKNGLSSTHRADVLYRKLGFMPTYAAESYLKFYLTRSYSRLKGIGRLFVGKFLKPKVVRWSSTPWRMLKFAISRQFTLTL
ncbi:MAG: LPS biosynthesis glycosyltransferase, partial [Crocosphaera sp.]